MMRPGGESPRATLLWSMVTIAGLCLGVGVSRIPALATVWDIGGGAFERRESQDARNDGYYEELLDAGERRGGGGWFTSPAATMPAHWPRLHETEGVIWDEPFQRFRLRPGADFDYKGAPLGINDLGLRDRPTTLEKASGVHRVALVGASILMGSGVPVAETFENRIEDAVALGVLGERGPVELLNFGVAGYRIDQLADVVLTQLDAFDPEHQVALADPGAARGPSVARVGGALPVDEVADPKGQALLGQTARATLARAERGPSKARSRGERPLARAP